jgi:solute carrier family 25 protein 33/36
MSSNTAPQRPQPRAAFQGALNFQPASPGMLPKLPSVELPKLAMPKLSVQGMCNLAAGGIAGAFASAITCPLEVIKTNLQSRANVGSGLNPLTMGAQILRTKGPRGLYRGLSLSLMGIIPTRSCYFWAYGASKGALASVIGDCPATHMVSAVAAGGLSSTLTCPLWMIKTRMQLQGTNLAQTAQSIVAESGVKGLYRGLKASYWGLSEGAIQFLMYEKVKTAMREANGGADLSTMQYLLAAGGTKGLASVLTYPHEVVRTRMREAGSMRYQRMLQSIVLIGKEEGRRGLYSGLGPHLMRVVPNTAIMFMSFEVLSKHLPAVIEQRKWEAPFAAAHDKLCEVQRGVGKLAPLMMSARVAAGCGSISSHLSLAPASLAL